MQHIEREDVRAQLESRGIDPDHIKSLHVKLQTGELDHSSFVIEADRLRAPQLEDVSAYERINKESAQQTGIDALQADELTVFWLNGGAATRYFDESKLTDDEKAKYGSQLAVDERTKSLPKGVTPVLQDVSYLEFKIRDLLRVSKQYQLEVHPHVILMNSFITDKSTREHLEKLFIKYPDLDPARFHFVVQEPSIPRFQKVDDLKNIDLFVGETGELSYAPCGHGDFIHLLQDYLKQAHMKGPKYMFFANIDNLGATLDTAMLGHHIQSGKDRTVELAQKQAGDKGGAPCYVDGELVIVEQMKFPSEFDQDSIRWFNTNTFWFNIEALMQFDEDLPLVLAEKTIDDGDVFQLEHFACDVHLPSEYVVIERARRFWPIKRSVDILLYTDPSIDNQQHKDFAELLDSVYGIKV